MAIFFPSIYSLRPLFIDFMRFSTHIRSRLSLCMVVRFRVLRTECKDDERRLRLRTSSLVSWDWDSSVSSSSPSTETSHSLQDLILTLLKKRNRKAYISPMERVVFRPILAEAAELISRFWLLMWDSYSWKKTDNRLPEQGEKKIESVGLEELNLVFPFLRENE